MGMQFVRNMSQGAWRLRGTNVQDDPRVFLFQVPTRQVAIAGAMQQTPPTAPSIQTVFDTGLCTTSYDLNNRSGSAGVLGYGYCWHNSMWKAGTWTDATSTFTDDTADAQDTGADDFGMGIAVASDAANDGWMILSRRPWSWLSVDVTTASETNASYTVSYSNTAGTGWTTLVANQAIVDVNATISASVVPTGELLFCWNPPATWGAIRPQMAGLSAYEGWYGWRIQIDAATPTVLALASGMELGSMKFSQEAVADNASASDDNISYVDYDAIGVVALFPAATTGNYVDAVVFPCG